MLKAFIEIILTCIDNGYRLNGARGGSKVILCLILISKCSYSNIINNHNVCDSRAQKK